MDATYHADLRELNEINFARFDAKLDQRVIGVEARIEGLEARIESRLVASEAKIEQRFVERFADSESRMIRWMVGLWTGTMLAFVGLILAVLRSK